MTKTAFVHDPACLQHDTGPSHPEGRQRLEAIETRLHNSALFEDLDVICAGPADPDKLLLVHDRAMRERVRQTIEAGGSIVDADDTAVSKGSSRAALGAVGCGLEAADGVMRGDFDNAFALCRPPGHHAEKDRAMGFCLANNIAIAAQHLRNEHGLDRIAIVDWDVHHGNGTQHVFERDPGVFFASLHQFPHYPGTGAEHERGIGPGEGATRNAPLAAGTGDREWIRALEELILPELERFAPQFVLISAGFDAHVRDPLSETLVTEPGYTTMTDRLCDLARRYAGGRIVSFLEGGYDMEGLAGSVEAHIAALRSY